MADHASLLLDGVPGSNDVYATQPQISQQQYTMPQQQYYAPPPPTGPMVTVNNGSGGEVSPVMASTPKSMLTMPEGYEDFKPDEHMNVSVRDAINIIGEPRGEHVGQGIIMPQNQIMMPQQQPPQAQPVNPHQVQNIMDEPVGEHVVNNSNGGVPVNMSNIADHASQLL